MFNSLPRFVSALALAVSATLMAQAPPDAPPQMNLPQRAPVNPNLPTIFVVGDSTASNGLNLGWGDHLANYFDLAKVNVVNRAHAGRSSRSYMVEGAWDKVLAELKPGDYVMLQWGQNDGGDLGGAKPRGDLRGDGDATEDVMQSVGVLAGKVETVHTYGWYNRKYVANTLAKGATPMFLSMTIHNSWKPDARGTLHVALDMRFGPVMWKIAQEKHLAFIDMAPVEAARMESVGKEKAAAWFPIDYVHTSPEGAELNAQSVVIALEMAKSPLVKYLKVPLAIPEEAIAATKISQASLEANVATASVTPPPHPVAPPAAAPATPQ
ncbi:MAG: GDSL-type esterase/lipase family protein [Acidobacteriota bacterium]|nr:GDSL-type esterase/lipase family protein [Acidobacteriota bacterium]